MIVAYSNSVLDVRSFDPEAFLERNRTSAIVCYEFITRNLQTADPLELYLVGTIDEKISTDPTWSRDHAIIHKAVDDFQSRSYWLGQRTH